MGTRIYVTGASRGLGRALAATAPDDAEVVDISRSGSDLPGVRHVAADLSSPDGWARLGDLLDDELAGYDGDRVTFVHNAGTLTPMGFAGEVDDAAYTANVLLNAAAPQVLGHRFLRAVADLECRRELVLLSSGAARTAYPGWSSYGAAKAAVDQWVRAVAAEQAQRGGVRVHAVAPGVVDTGMQDAIRGMDERDFPRVARFRELHAEGALRDPDEVARQLWAGLERGLPDPVVDLRDL
jgi:benzil reductase ((S)-benzoin forming)